MSRRQYSFFTPVKLPKTEWQIDCHDLLVGIGSCFAQTMLEKLFSYGFSGLQNPSGILYNAVSIQHTVSRAIANLPFRKDEFFYHQGRWHSWEHHGKFSHTDLETAQQRINRMQNEFHCALHQAKYFIITPSSAVVFRLKASGQIVANCHKVDNRQFERQLLSMDENYQALKTLFYAVHDFNPDCRLIFTLSPVRHYPGDLVMNSTSKAHLLTAIHRLVDKYSGQCHYFPTYEIMHDELRDYRFYRDDMLHPSALAEDIIFDRFVEHYFTPAALEKITVGQQQARRAAHRPLQN